jgi:hypothetical protein
MRHHFIRTLAGVLAASYVLVSTAAGQAPGSAGTVEGVVTDPSGGAVAGAAVTLGNPISGFRRAGKTDTRGAFRFRNIPPNIYHLAVASGGFESWEQDVPVRTAVPITLAIALRLAGERTSVTVHGEEADLLENVPYAHNDMDRAMYAKLPATSPGAGLSDAITMSSPGVVADSNGFFHPLGDHAQTSFSIDGQPVNDQQSKQFSTQFPVNAIQSVEMITGAPSAEFGDKTGLVVNAQTRTGIGQKPFGSFAVQYGSFGTVAEETAFGMGNDKIGNFLAANAVRSGRFLDTPEFRPHHAAGNNQTVFDHIDWHPNQKDAIHINLLAARNWFQTPNNNDQPTQDQRQRVLTYNFAPGYQRTVASSGLFNVNFFVRRDQVDYYPSRDPFDDTPATVSQQRFLTNYGLRSDLGYVRGIHNVKVGMQAMQTRLKERFSLGITDPDFNVGEEAQPGLVPFDLTRGGSLFRFTGRANINQLAFYAQDAITWKGLAVNAGLRVDRYDGLSEATAAQPRLGLSYLVKPSGTILRAAYSRTLETPYNENLVLSSSTGAGGLAGNVFGAAAAKPIEPGRRNQFNVGFQQSVLKWLQVDGDYFWKFTDNAYDFGTLLDSPLVFPISWRKSKIDGVSLRLATPNLRGFQAFTTMGHTRARFFGPSNGGLIFNSAVSSEVFRIDHDQAFQQTTHLRYQRGQNGPWAAFTWRYDSGLVAGAVTGLEDALALTPAQQAAIGFSCSNPGCTSYTVSRLRIPADGSWHPDHNPGRIAPRHIFDIGLGTDDLLHTEHYRATLKFTVTNLSNRVALYNFLSTFSGTHFVTPRAYQAEIGFVF